ncbi:MAG: ADP-ribosylglycohydrolase family protein [Janthinobacterium lividum]
MNLASSPDARLARAVLSLEGLSVGDAFGERYFTSGADELIAARTLASRPWHYTDDTQMALSIVSVLRQHSEIDQDKLATNFSVHYDEDRGYGDAMNHLVPMIYLAGMWRMMAPRLFSGEGSLGNGAAMRVAPLGAYFADEPALAAAQAVHSAEVTHAHPEGIAGAVAIASAAAYAARLHGFPLPKCSEFLALILPHVPLGLVADGLCLAASLPADTTVREAARLLGSGYNATAPDTVPFALWCAGQYLGDYEEAMWLTASGLGDIDTTCAIVGGIVALSAGPDSIPSSWITAREPLPRWPFQETSEI